MDILPDQEIQQISMHRPYVVIVGAGGSRAAFPNCQRSGRRLPVMEDFLEIVPVRGVLGDVWGISDGHDFEAAYSALVDDPSRANSHKRLESAVDDYFDSLQPPDTLTLYVHLILSLRPKDVITTFNWDPFLVQAAHGNRLLEGNLGRLVFLPGNVLAGYCPRDHVRGTKNTVCSRCGRLFE